MTNTVTLPSGINLEEMKLSFGRHGYAIARELLSAQEVDEIRQSFDRIAAGGAIPGHFEPVSSNQSEGDPLKEFLANTLFIPESLLVFGIYWGKMSWQRRVCSTSSPLEPVGRQCIRITST
jgi:hypothetical protein